MANRGRSSTAVAPQTVLEWLEDQGPKRSRLIDQERLSSGKPELHKHPLSLTYDDLEDIAILAGALRKQDVGPTKPSLRHRAARRRAAADLFTPAVQSGTVSLTIRRPSSRVSELKERFISL